MENFLAPVFDPARDRESIALRDGEARATRRARPGAAYGLGLGIALVGGAAGVRSSTARASRRAAGQPLPALIARCCAAGAATSSTSTSCTTS